MEAPGHRRGSLTRRLAAVAVLAAIGVALVVGLLLRSTVGLSDAQQAANRSERILTAVARTEKLVIDLETGLRGWLITGQERFLEPYRRSTREVPEAVIRLGRAVTGNAAQRDRVDRIESRLIAYQRDHARPLLAQGRPPSSSRRAVELVSEGKARLDQLRGDLTGFAAVERRRLARRSAAADRTSDRAVLVGVVALALLLALVGVLAVFVDRTIVRPVLRFGEAVERLRRGDLGVRVGHSGPEEIASLGGAIDELAGSLSESRSELEQRNAELRRLSERNLVLLDSVFAQTPVGLAFLDSELRYVRVNPAFAAITGWSVAAHVGHRIDEVVPDLGGEAVPVVERVIATGEALPESEVVGSTAADPGVDHTWAVTYYPIRQDGVVVGAGIVALDISDRKRAEEERADLYAAERDARRLAEAARRRASFLADAGGVLDASLDVDETVQSLARLSVPRIADWCSVELVDPDGVPRNAAVAHSDPQKIALALDLQRRFPSDPQAATGASAVIRSGRPELYPDVTEEMLDTAELDPEYRAILSTLGMRSAMTVPLTARGQTLGAITLISAESGRRFDADDYALAQDLGARAGLSLDNARLYRERSHVAQTLQASLLPEQLPEIPGVRIAARYEPLGASTEVGGDFYDIFPTGPDRWAVVIGDVCGKGAEAAALTALARYTLRAVAPLSPADALRRLNTAILRQRNDLRFITIVYAELDLSGPMPRVTFASGGHPPPLLIHRTGPGRVIECQGTLIGITPDPSLTECALELAQGDTLALYTDGVTEASHAEPLEPDGLLALLEGDRTADAIADHMQRLARSDGTLARDDVAIVALQVA